MSNKFGHLLGKLVLSLAVLTALACPAAAQQDLGVVLMYGKNGSWSTSLGLRDMASILQKAGAKVSLPEMPWRRGAWESNTMTVPQVYALIDREVEALKAKGATRIVVGGHSLGANMALSYAVARGNLAGLVMAAPGHSPDSWYMSDKGIKAAVDKVKELYDAGKGKESFRGPDLNQDERATLTTTVEAYGSWMSPRGRAAMKTQAPKLPETTPIFVGVSRDEPGYATAQPYIYKPAAKNPYSVYVETVGEHKNVDFAVSKRAADWILGLPK
jgi:esterase/lipase